MTEKLTPPVAGKRPHSFTHHGITVTDDYAWLRDPKYPTVDGPDILAHLEAENAYFEAHMAAQKPLIDSLYAEMRARIKEEDSSVPQRSGPYLYWSSFEEGAEYRKYWRRPVDGGADECILDETELAKGLDYFNLNAFSVSRDHRLLAYSYDDDGSERFTIRIKDLASGDLLPDTIEGTLSDVVWAADTKSFLYCPANEQWRTEVALLHRLGTDPASDVELYREADTGFRVDVGETSSERFLLISTGDHETSEIRLIPAEDPTAATILVSPRQNGREYSVEEHEDTLYILTNDTHINFRLATAPISAPAEWTTLIAGSDHAYLTGFTAFKHFYVLDLREDGLDQIEVRYYNEPARVERIAFPEASYDASLGSNPEWDQETLRLGYTSMVTPHTVYDYDVAGRMLTTLKVQEVPSGYDPTLYTTERLMVQARDGAMVPVSILYRKDRKGPREGGAKEMGAPLFLYGYGAYGIAISPSFSTTNFSLVDRGYAFAIAHIRGGDDMGRRWYLDGKLEKRTNSFNDFVDVAKGLIERGFVARGRIAISGGSAGGELMGAVINSDPDLWGAVVAHVPFVDVLNTMLDETLPLTPGEWPEWGNPITDKAAFELIQSYCPYSQVRAQAYPPMMVTAGLNDPRVTYWEPAKWVAKLREFKTDDAILLSKTNMGAGHGGKSGRWESLKETAEEFGFILWVMGEG